ncbi:hypothetical protein [Natronoglycomyces albus]|uniref:Uncharacterized protein n=1 Tax=Natronoglycomyces albus TaxID=2811108 RepID=A0A895XQD7_9ACTN|nr:hypothetical protein [Natronoglycomyces albus]QSB05753.1 hypothetical protein JQS30_02145 [Natronoglycomyces albus]
MDEKYTYTHEAPEWFRVKNAPMFGWQRGSQYVELFVSGKNRLRHQYVPEGGFDSQEEFDAYCREALEEMGPEQAHRLAWRIEHAFLGKQ